MNNSSVRAIKTFKGWMAEFRPCWKADYLPVLETDDKGRKVGVKYFKTEDAAEVAAWRAKHEAEQSIMVRSGEIITAARQEAESYFVPQKERKLA